MTAVGYIRRSNGGESVISRSAQETAIAAAAAARGDHVGRLYVDWGRSGSDRSRPEFLSMVAAIESGQVSAVYAYDSDRLARRTATLAMMLDAASEAGVPVIDRLGRDLSGNDRLVGEFMGVVDSEMLRKMTVRARENARRRKARGDEDGPAPYGHRREWTGERWRFVVDDPEAIARIVGWYRETRSLQATARRLNRAGVPTAKAIALTAQGKPVPESASWKACSVQRVIDRNAPELRDGAKGQGVRAASKPRVLSRLLRCHCGQVMSPATHHEWGTRWYCRSAVVGVHDGPRGISETKLLPWVREEAARLIPPLARVRLAAHGDADRQMRARVIQSSIDTLRATGVAESSIAPLLSELAALAGDTPMTVADVPPAVDWTQPVVVINAVLRAMWHSVELGEDLTPVEARWVNPAWRRD